MTTIFIILTYGIPASLLLSVVILVVELIHPRLLLRGYPKDVQATVSPLTQEEKRKTLFWAVPFWLLLVGFPTAAALEARASDQGFLFIFLSAFGVIFLSNLVDWLILDWLIICTITPKFVVLPGTEGMAGYKNYAMHFRGFLIGTVLAAVVGFIVAILTTLL